MTLRGPGQEEYDLEEARERQRLNHGCIALLAFVDEVPTAALGLKDILIAREIPGVSPPGLILMPPVKESEIELKIAINVVLETAPTSAAPH